MRSSPPARVTVLPERLFAKAIVSAPGCAFARATASRSELAPPSTVVVTRNTLGSALCSRPSRVGRKCPGRRCLREGALSPKNHRKDLRNMTHLQSFLMTTLETLHGTRPLPTPRPEYRGACPCPSAFRG